MLLRLFKRVVLLQGQIRTTVGLTAWRCCPQCCMAAVAPVTECWDLLELNRVLRTHGIHQALTTAQRRFDATAYSCGHHFPAGVRRLGLASALRQGYTSSSLAPAPVVSREVGADPCPCLLSRSATARQALRRGR